MLKPVGNRVILRRCSSEPDSKASAFIIPDAAKEKATECVVVAVGGPYFTEWGYRMEPPVREGDHVLVGKYTAEHKHRGEDYLILRWDELLAVVDGSPSVADLDAVESERAIADATRR